MKHVRLLAIANSVFGILVLQAGCEAPMDENPPLPRKETKSTEPPPDEPVNPQRNPEKWKRPPGTSDSPDFSKVVTPPDDGSIPPSPMDPLPYRGINLASAEFGSALPGKYGTDYTFPTHDEIDYYVSRGMTTFRIGFRWERVQPEAKGSLEAEYLGRLEDVVSYATSKGAYAIPEPHNFARYYGEVVGSSKVPNEVFADFWGKLSARFKDNPRVMLNLVNEPHDMPTEQWVGAANAAIAAIRAAGATNTIIVPGNSWTGAAQWASDSYGTPNSVAMLKIEDSKDNIFFEVHQYLDSDASGSHTECVSTTVGSERLQPFVKWLRDNGKKGFLGEFAGADNANCKQAIRNMLDTIHESSDVLVGWLWWAGGPWWHDYMFTLDPKENGEERPQIGWLTPFLKKK